MQSNSLKPIKRRAGRAEFFSIRKELETKILLGHPLLGSTPNTLIDLALDMCSSHVTSLAIASNRVHLS